MDKVSYALGLGIGQQLSQMGASELNIDDFAQAIKDVINGSELKVQHREAQQIVQDYFAKQEEKINAQRAEQGKAQKEAGEKYLAENAKKEGVVTTKSGLQYKVLQEGKGKQPTAKDTVMCHYELRGLPHRRYRLRQQRTARRARHVPPAAGDCRLDGGSAADERGCQVPFLHPLPSGLRRGRCRCIDSSLCHPHLRRGADSGHLIIIT